MTVYTRGDTKLLYVHVPKTGGTSIELAFRKAGWVETYREPRHAENQYTRCSPQHMHARQLADTFWLKKFHGIFMTVREPIARFRSEYLMRHDRRKSFPVDAASVEEWAFNQFERQRRNPYHLDNHLRPQSEFLVPRARVYKLEDGLDTMLKDINETFEIDGPSEAPRVKEGGTAHAVSSRDIEISDRLRDELHVRYASDYRMFGYEV